MINAKYLLTTSHLKRMHYIIFCMAFAFFLIAMCCFDPGDREVFFWISLIAAILQGSACALGETTTLGFLKGFPSKCVGFFSSGTGFAGIFGCSFLILLKAASFSDGTIFLIAAPTLIPYLLSWHWLSKQQKLYPNSYEERPADAQEISVSQIV